MECDVLGTSLSVVLHQGNDAIAFFSRPIVGRHDALAAYERKLIGLVQAIRHWWPYLWGRSFLIWMDHYSLKFLLDQRLATIPQHQWDNKLLGFVFPVEYRPCRLNIVTDALSHCDSDIGASFALSAPHFNLLATVRTTTSDPTLVALRDQITFGNLGGLWTMVDGLVLFNKRVYVLSNSALGTSLPPPMMLPSRASKRLHRLCCDFHTPQARSVL